MDHHHAPSRRFLFGTALLALLSASGAAQVDDPDLDLSPWSQPAQVRCLRLAATNDGVLIAAFILQSGPPVSQQDRLVVTRSLDRGRTWRTHYVEPTGGLFYKDM